MAKPPPTKPQGFDAAIRAWADRHEIIATELPAVKADTEFRIMKMFERTLATNENPPFSLGSWKPNVENDFDFDVEVNGCKGDLELVEFAPAAAMQSGGFAGAPNSYTVGQMVDYLREVIEKKASHYVKAEGMLILLVYQVHFAFSPSDHVFQLVQGIFSCVRHPFSHIIFFATGGNEMSRITPLFPVRAKHLSVSQRNAIRQNQIINVDPRTFEQHPKGGVLVRVPLPRS